MTRRYSSELPNFATHSPEDSQPDRNAAEVYWARSEWKITSALAADGGRIGNKLGAQVISQGEPDHAAGGDARDRCQVQLTLSDSDLGDLPARSSVGLGEVSGEVPVGITGAQDGAVIMGNVTETGAGPSPAPLSATAAAGIPMDVPATPSTSCACLG